MKRFILSLVLLCLSTCQPVYAGYSIITRDQVTPREITVYGVGSMDTVLNPGAAPVYPATVIRKVCQAKDIYSPTATDRAEVWEDSAGAAVSADLFANCPQIRKQKIATIRAAGSAALLSLSTPYSAEERESWAQQSADAIEYQSNQNCTCSLMRNMATTRGIPLSIMADKILENATLFKTVSGQILGKQQKLIDQIEVEQDFTTLERLTW